MTYFTTLNDIINNAIEAYKEYFWIYSSILYKTELSYPNFSNAYSIFLISLLSNNN